MRLDVRAAHLHSRLHENGAAGVSSCVNTKRRIQDILPVAIVFALVALFAVWMFGRFVIAAPLQQPAPRSAPASHAELAPAAQRTPGRP